MILKYISNKQDGSVWAGLIWFTSITITITITIQYRDKSLPVVKTVLEALGSINCGEFLSQPRNC
jgi:hypothetical protein